MPAIDPIIKKSDSNCLYTEAFYQAKRVMIIAPHPDDEVLGCGGTLLHYYKNEAIITVEYLTDGRYGLGGLGREMRKEEARSIKSMLPAIQQHFYDFEDSKLHEHRIEVTDILAHAIQNYKPDVILSPWVLDRHPDHHVTSCCLSKALVISAHDCLIACYEIMTPLMEGQSINITEYLDMKNALIDCYASQVSLYNVKKIINSLNSYRAALCRRESIKAAECYYLTDSNNFTLLVEHHFSEYLNSRR